MPYRLSKDVTVRDDGGGQKLFLKGTLFEQAEGSLRKNGLGEKLVDITRSEAGKLYTSEVAVKLLRPVYGQTSKANGYLIEGTEQARALCKKFSEALLKLPWKSYAGNTKRAFMIGVLMGVDMDDKPVNYAAISANQYVAPRGWVKAAEQLGLKPAPDLPKFHEHGRGDGVVTLRNLSGKIIKPIKPGKRLSERAGPNARTTNWDVPDGVNPAIDRKANEPGACAAPKMIQLAIKSGVTIHAMWEQWFDQGQDIKHEVPMDSCATCRVNITRMLKR